MQTPAEIDRIVDRQLAREIRQHCDKIGKQDARDENIANRAMDKFKALPDFYTGENKLYRYTNMDDAIGDLNQPELISIARAVRDGDKLLAGEILSAALMRICTKQAEYEIDEEMDK